LNTQPVTTFGLVEVCVGELGDSKEALGTVMGVAPAMEAVRTRATAAAVSLAKSFLSKIDVRFIRF
jgi:hypothetical protein